MYDEQGNVNGVLPESTGPEALFYASLQWQWLARATYTIGLADGK